MRITEENIVIGELPRTHDVCWKFQFDGEPGSGFSVHTFLLLNLSPFSTLVSSRPLIIATNSLKLNADSSLTQQMEKQGNSS